MERDGTRGMLIEREFLDLRRASLGKSSVDQENPSADGQAESERPNDARLSNPELDGLGLVTPAALDQICSRAASTQWVVDGLIARGSLNIAVGDSGLGKSPLFYQLGLCVAGGIRWLGIPTTKGLVVYVDFENAELNSQGIRNALVKHLGLAACPNNFLTHFGEKLDLERVVREVKPVLVIIDSLRSYKPEVEEKNSLAGSFLSELRKLARETGAAFLLIHHTRKPAEHETLALEDSPALEWLNQACGARALINQTDFRLAIDREVGAISGATLGNAEELALVIRGHIRVIGGFGPIHLSRVFDGASGAELGYRKIVGLDMLSGEQRKVFEQLLGEFTFGEAKTTYNSITKKGDQAISDFLKKCIACDLLEQPVPRGPYKKR